MRSDGRQPSSATARTCELRHGQQPERGHGRLRDEDRAPAERLRQDAAERRAEREPERPREDPDPRTIRRRAGKRAEHRERTREEQRGADALHGPGADQKPEAVRERACDRRAEEHGQPGCEHPRRPEPVDEQDERERRDRDRRVVGRDDPRDALDRRVEARVELGKREDDDRRVGEGDRDCGRDKRGQSCPGARQRPQPGGGSRRPGSMCQ